MLCMREGPLTLEVAACVQHVGGQRDLEGALHLLRNRVIDVPLLQQGTRSAAHCTTSQIWTRPSQHTMSQEISHSRAMPLPQPATSHSRTSPPPEP